MSDRFVQMETCARLAQRRDDASLRELAEILEHRDWQVRYAAAVALGDRPDVRAVTPLLKLLAEEDAAPLYTQQSEGSGIPAGCPFPVAPTLGGGATEALRSAWQRRGRIKQAACLALGRVGARDPRVLDALHRYATDPREDAAVRSAACLALGFIGDGASRPVLERAAQDDEWCTRTEATKAIAALTDGDKPSTSP
jgi:HEAT repeat protein